MTKRALLRAWMVTCGLLVVQGCKTNTAKDANWKPVVVLEQGMAPQLPLRYAIAEGSTTTSTMELTIPSQTTTTSQSEAFTKAPGLRIVVATGPAAKLANGNTRVDINIVEAEAITHAGTDPEVARDFGASAGLLRGVGGWIEVDDRGVIQKSDLNEAAKSANLPIRLLMTVIQARSSLARVVFPFESVGLGGRWEARKQVEMFGFEIEQVDRYKLLERVGDELRLAVEIAESAPKQTVEFEDQGMKVKLESLSVSARGDLVVHFDALEASGRVEGRATEVLSVKGRDGKENIELDSAFRVDIAVEDAAGDAINP